MVHRTAHSVDDPFGLDAEKEREGGGRAIAVGRTRPPFRPSAPSAEAHFESLHASSSKNGERTANTALRVLKSSAVAKDADHRSRRARHSPNSLHDGDGLERSGRAASDRSLLRRTRRGTSDQVPRPHAVRQLDEP